MLPRPQATLERLLTLCWCVLYSEHPDLIRGGSEWSSRYRRPQPLDRGLMIRAWMPSTSDSSAVVVMGAVRRSCASSANGQWARMEEWNNGWRGNILHITRGNDVLIGLLLSWTSGYPLRSSPIRVIYCIITSGESCYQPESCWHQMYETSSNCGDA